jgi:hypothetical protein
MCLRVAVESSPLLEKNGQVRRFLDPEMNVGIQFDDSPGSKIKEKKIYMNPLAPTGVGFSGKF